MNVYVMLLGGEVKGVYDINHIALARKIIENYVKKKVKMWHVTLENYEDTVWRSNELLGAIAVLRPIPLNR